jgi:integrase
MSAVGPDLRGKDMETLIEQWLDTYRAAGRSPFTVAARKTYVVIAAAHLDLLTCTPEQLHAYLASRAHLSPEARKSTVVALRSFFRWAHRRGHAAVDLSEELPTVTVPKGQPKPIPAAALEQARAAADAETLLIIDLAALAGLRRSEIARVHGDDVTDDGLLVHGKGGRVRLVPLHPRLRTRLQALQGWAFPSPVRAGQHVSPDYIASRVEAVVPSPWTAHSLRHYFATSAYRGTGDLRSVQQLLGHASVETTQRYVLVDTDALARAVSAVA